jgi:hypothetical protein
MSATEKEDIVHEADLLADGYTLLHKSPWLHDSLPEKYYWIHGKYMYIIGPGRAEKCLIIKREKEQQHAATNGTDSLSLA